MKEEDEIPTNVLCNNAAHSALESMKCIDNAAGNAPAIRRIVNNYKAYTIGIQCALADIERAGLYSGLDARLGPYLRSLAEAVRMYGLGHYPETAGNFRKIQDVKEICFDYSASEWVPERIMRHCLRDMS